MSNQDTLQQQLSAANARIVELTGTTQKVETTCDELRIELEATTARKSELEKQYSDAAYAAKEQTARSQTLEASCAQLQQRVLILQRQMEQQVAHMGQTEEQLKHSDAQRQQLAEAHNELRTAKQQAAAFDAEATASRSECERLKLQLSSNQDTLQ
eukprot:PhM_4_TR16516/c0_g1_i4/m.92363